MSPSEIKRYAEKHGVEFSSSGDASGWSVDCWSPDGFVWKATGTHFLALPGDGYYTRPDWKQTHRALREAVEFGFEKCTDSDCPVCHE